MAILIKGMEMPKNCGGCFLRVGQCSRRIYMENRPSACPLIEVHEPHGRLGDLDALDAVLKKEIESFGYDVYGCGIADGLTLARACTESAPTVISASKEAK